MCQADRRGCSSFFRTAVGRALVAVAAIWLLADGDEKEVAAGAGPESNVAIDDQNQPI
jgi:hypothetical protein